MTNLLTSAQMRAIEAAAIASGSVTGLELMERAGRGVVEAVLAEWPELAEGAHRAVVLCGPGNNGGDGFVIARLLAARGWAVEVFLYGDPERLPPDARANYDRWRGMGAVKPLTGTLEPSTLGAVIVVDALFGTGLARPVEGLEHVLRDLIDCVNCTFGTPVSDRFDNYPFVVSVDTPSGLCLDSGRVLFPPSAPREKPLHGLKSWVARANLTVTFHRMKLGHFLDIGPHLCGKLRVCDIGLREGKREDERCGLLDEEYRVRAGHHARKLSKSHKYAHGHALILSGPSGHGGAARLAARGALRIGAGLVTVGCPPEAVVENATRLDAVMLRPIADAGALARVLEDRRINALCLGPGLGLDARAAGLVAAVLAAGGSDGEAPRPGVVLDADALALIARDPALFGLLHGQCVLTPHGGEFARLFPDIAERLAAPATAGPAFSKVDAAREAAARAGCTVLFKGPDTVIAEPSGRASINASVYDRAAPWLATAGSGDVLAGFIAGLLARGFSPFEAAGSAAWLHTEAARSFGPGLIAEDLPEELPKVFRALGL